MNVDPGPFTVRRYALSNAIRRASVALDHALTIAGAPESRPATTPVMREALARAVLMGRRRRSATIPNVMFGELAWDMLLELYVCSAVGRLVSVSSACLASGVPMTTALRQVGLLEQAGYLKRDPDPNDRRRVWLKLSGEATRMIDLWLDEMLAVLS